jgi:hypothetical protein
MVGNHELKTVLANVWFIRVVYIEDTVINILCGGGEGCIQHFGWEA